MKTIAFAIMIFFAGTANASTVSPLRDSTSEKVRAEKIMQRLTDIQCMDVASLSASEKQDLRKELKGLKKEAKDFTNKGVYLSVGAIIIIILLLILIK